MKLVFSKPRLRGSSNAVSFIPPSLDSFFLCCPHPLMLHMDWPSPKIQERQPCASRFSNPKRKIFTNRREKQWQKFHSVLKFSVSIVESIDGVCVLFTGFENKHKWVTNMIDYLIKPGSVCVDLRLRERSLRYVSLQAPIVVASYAVN